MTTELCVTRDDGNPDAPDAAATEAVENNRRGFLKLAGIAAAGATVAAIAGAAEPAAAATGAALLIGSTNSPSLANQTTSLFNPAATLDSQVFRVDNNTVAPPVIPANLRVAVVGAVSGSGAAEVATGVYGRITGPTGQGVFGSANGVDNPFPGSTGVAGTAGTGGVGVLGYVAAGANSVGVRGLSNFGIGVLAESDSGLAVSVLGFKGGRLMQQPTPTAGAPLGVGVFGEQIRDTAGDLYICIVAGTPGTWRKVTAQHPAYANAGGSINLLAQPIRLFDTRPASTAPLNNSLAKVSAGVIVTLQITGTVASGLSVPAGAKGILGNITVVAPDNGGYAQVWPSGPLPSTSNLNFSVLSATPAIANSLICALTPAGTLNISTSARSDILLDVTGFIY